MTEPIACFGRKRAVIERCSENESTWRRSVTASRRVHAPICTGAKER